MGIRSIDTNLSLFRLIKGGDHGLNLSLMDIYGLEIEVPDLLSILKTTFTRKPIRIRVKERSANIINKLIKVQSTVDKEIEKKIKEAERNMP